MDPKHPEAESLEIHVPVLGLTNCDQPSDADGKVVGRTSSLVHRSGPRWAAVGNTIERSAPPLSILWPGMPEMCIQVGKK